MKTAIVLATAALACGVAAPALADPIGGGSVGIEVSHEDYNGADGAVWAVTAGWDVKVAPKWVVGLGVRAAIGGVDETSRQTLGANVATARVAIKDQVGAGLRGGRIFGNRLLVFGEVGQEWFHVDAVRDLRGQACAPPNGCLISRLDASFDETMTTYALGAEWSISDTWSLRGAYAYGESDAFERSRFSLGASYQF